MTTMRATSRHRKEVFTGRYIDYDDPQPDQISIEDVAHGLAYTCRFGGHTSRFYSVAEHALMVSGLVASKGHEELALAALHHDDHEAYLGDLPTPLKNALGDVYESMREKVDAAICEALDLNPAALDAPAVHWADAQALRWEAHLLLPSRGEHHEWAPAWEKWGLHVVQRDVLGNWSPGLSPARAEREFLRADEFLRARS